FLIFYTKVFFVEKKQLAIRQEMTRVKQAILNCLFFCTLTGWSESYFNSRSQQTIQYTSQDRGCSARSATDNKRAITGLTTGCCLVDTGHGATVFRIGS